MSFTLTNVPWLRPMFWWMEICGKRVLWRISRSHIVVGSISQPVPQQVSGNLPLMGQSCNPSSEQIFWASSNVASRLQGLGDIHVEPSSSQHLTACSSLSSLEIISPGNLFKHPLVANWYPKKSHKVVMKL